MSRVTPRGQLRAGDVVVVYRSPGGQHHHTTPTCGLLAQCDGEVESSRVAVDGHGGVQVRDELCGVCDPVYQTVGVDE